MHLRLFGAPVLTLDDGSTRPFAPERRYRLLAVLAMERRWIARERLAALFWPGRSASAARANLRKLLLELRALAVPGLEDTPAGLRWAVPSDLAQHESALDRGDCDAATALVAGAPLQGLESGSAAFDDWLGGERARLLGRWRRAVLAAIDDADPATAARWCERLLAIDPLDEEAMALRARAAPACGLSDTVRAELHRFNERLGAELGVEPSQRLRACADGLERETRRPEAPASALLGRTAELAQAVARLADPQTRLLTLLGPGGVGKTRLAQAVLREAAPGRATWWVPLEDLLTPAALPGRVAEHVRPGLALPAESLPFLARQWPDHRAGPGLLVLDGFEAVIDAGAWLQRLLAEVPGLQVLVTSRERLDLPVEWVLPLAGLGAPAADADAATVLAHPAVDLFVQRARRLDPGFDPAADWPALRRLCASIDGLPLALELAASWVRLLPTAQIAHDLAEGAGWLAAGGQPLRASFEQSWSLLTPAEREGFARLAVFRGGFTREAADQVAGVALPVLASLVDKCMLRRAGAGRFDRHALAHAFARERLAAQPAWQRQMAARHGRWALAQWLQAPGDHAGKRAALAAERDNLLQAWQHWIDTADAAALEAAAEPLSWFHVVEGRLPDGLGLLAAAEAAPGLPATTAALLRAHGAWLALWLDQHDAAGRRADQALAVLEPAGHRAGTLLALRTLAHLARRRGRHAESAALLDRAVRLARRAGDARALAVLIDARAMAWTMLGRYRRAIGAVHEALALNLQLGQEAQCMYNEFNLAQAHAFGGDAAAARPWTEASLARARSIGYRFFEPYAACQRALVRLQQGEIDGAAADAAAAGAQAEAMAGQPALPWALELQARVALARHDAGAALALAQRGLATARGAGIVMMEASLLPVLAAAEAAAGDRAAALATLDAMEAGPPPQAAARAEARALRARLRRRH